MKFFNFIFMSLTLFSFSLFVPSLRRIKFYSDFKTNPKRIFIELSRVNLPPYKPVLNTDSTVLTREINEAVLKFKKKNKDFILVDKSQKKLFFFFGGKLKYNFPVVIGFNKNDKERGGDKATPEGVFYICSINENSKYGVFFGISYPNLEDGKRGLDKELINKNEYDRISRAIRNKKVPPWYTSLGGSVGIHGPILLKKKRIRFFNVLFDVSVLAGCSRLGTLGCVSTDIDYLEKLSKDIGLGTRVIIQK